MLCLCRFSDRYGEEDFVSCLRVTSEEVKLIKIIAVPELGDGPFAMLEKGTVRVICEV